MKILIATQNNSKFNIISKMIKSILGENIELKNLNEYKDYKDEIEIGDNLNRAKQKAYNAKNQLKEEFDIILGIDDGIILNDVEYVSVKDKLYDIVVGDKYPIGETIYITRTYYLINKDNVETYVLNKIPYIIQKKLKQINLVGYPLNDVISTIDNDIVLSSRDEEELNEYFLKYSIKDLKDVL